MVSLADFTFEFDLATTSTPRTASPSYTALKTFVLTEEGITASRGRKGEQSATADPGNCSVVLRNTDQRFTMGNGSSPYAPLKLRRPGRLRVTYSATTYNLWQGFVNNWGNGRDQLTGKARLTLADRMSRLSPIKLPALIDGEILADSPVAYYPLDEAEGAAAGSDRSGTSGPQLVRRQTGVGGAFSFGAGSVGADAQTQAAFTPATVDDGKYLTVVNPNLAGSISGGGATLEAVVRLSDAAAVSAAIVVRWTGSGAQPLTIGIDSNLAFNLPSGAASDQPGPYWGRLVHVAVTITAAGAVTWYVNGVAQGGGTVAMTSTTMGDTLLVGADPTVPSSTFDGRVSHIAAYRTVLSAARIAEHAKVITGFDGDLTTDRFNRLCRVAGLPTAFYTTSGTTGVECGPQPTRGQDLLTLLTNVAQTELGALFVNDAGVLTLATAASRYNQAVAVTLDATKAGHVLANSIDFRTDTDSLINDSIATGTSGSAQRTADATSINDYDAHDEDEQTLHRLDAQALNWTQWRVASFKDPRPRAETVVVDVVAYANTGGNVANLLNAEIGQRLQLLNVPTDTSAVGTVDLFIEGIEYQVSKDTFRIKFTYSPLGLENTVWKLGTSLLGVGTVLG